MKVQLVRWLHTISWALWVDLGNHLQKPPKILYWCHNWRSHNDEMYDAYLRNTTPIIPEWDI